MIVLLCSCNNARQSADKVSEAERSALEDSYRHADSLYRLRGRIDTAAFLSFVRQTTDYVAAHPGDTISPEMLYRAGVASMILAKSAKSDAFRAGNAKKALAIFNDFQQLYPDNPSARYCYWQRAIVYEDILGDWRSAESEYRDFINRYPDDSLTPGFVQYITLLGKDSEELEKQLNIN